MCVQEGQEEKLEMRTESDPEWPGSPEELPSVPAGHWEASFRMGNKENRIRFAFL